MERLCCLTGVHAQSILERRHAEVVADGGHGAALQELML